MAKLRNRFHLAYVPHAERPGRPSGHHGECPHTVTQIVMDCKGLRRGRKRYRLDAVFRGRAADEVIAVTIDLHSLGIPSWCSVW